MIIAGSSSNRFNSAGGAVWIFNNIDGVWVERDVIGGGYARFGQSVAISYDEAKPHKSRFKIATNDKTFIWLLQNSEYGTYSGAGVVYSKM